MAPTVSIFLADNKFQYVSDNTPPRCIECLSINVCTEHQCTYFIPDHEGTINLTDLVENDKYLLFFCKKCSPFSESDDNSDEDDLSQQV